MLMMSVKSRGGLIRSPGIDEKVCSVQVSSMHECANVHLAVFAMSFSTGVNASNPDHVVVGVAWAIRDDRDLVKVIDYLSYHLP